jgi:hypothetical protein
MHVLARALFPGRRTSTPPNLCPGGSRLRPTWNRSRARKPKSGGMTYLWEREGRPKAPSPERSRVELTRYAIRRGLIEA